MKSGCWTQGVFHLLRWAQAHVHSGWQRVRRRFHQGLKTPRSNLNSLLSV